MPAVLVLLIVKHCCGFIRLNHSMGLIEASMLRKEATYVFAGSLGISAPNPTACSRSKKTCTRGNTDEIVVQVTFTSLQSINRRFVWRHCDGCSLEKISNDGIASANHSSPAIGIFQLA